MGPLGLDPIHFWAQAKNHDPTIGAVCGNCLCDNECNSWLGWDQAPISKSPRWEVMVASLLYYVGRIAKWYPVLGASNTMCVPCTPVRSQILANLVVKSTGPLLEEGASTQSDSRWLYGKASSGRYILISFDLLEWFNRALAMMGPRISYFGGIITRWQVSKC